MTAAQESGKSGEKTLVFSKPQQIAEILAEADKLKLQVLIRYTNDGKAVRGFVERADLEHERGIRIGGISSAGDSVLANYEIIKVEFVLLSKKIFFVSKIRARTTSRLLLSAPDKVYAIERRRNARFTVPKGISAIVEFESTIVDNTRFDAPAPNSIVEEQVSSPARLLIQDISLGGAALFTRFAAVTENLKPDPRELVATFRFPRMPPIHAPVTIRWHKKSTVRVLPGSHELTRRVISSRILSVAGAKNGEVEYNEVFHRLGIQFSEVSSELDAALREFINKAQTAESL